MIDWSLRPHVTLVAQFLILVATAVFIGGRFLPQRYRQRVGIAATVCYLAGIAAFLVYLLMR